MNEVKVRIAAAPERVWELVTDITRMGEWSPENASGRWTGGATGPALGARFTGRNRHGFLRWSTHCEVDECSAPRRFAFRVAENNVRWGWTLEPTDGGTVLTQWRERTEPPVLPVRALLATGLLGRNREELMVEGMHRTLAAVKAVAERSNAPTT